MVRTRSQYASAGLRPRAARLPLRGVRKRYAPNDTSHRHRLPDNQRKTVHVVTYSRRK